MIPPLVPPFSFEDELFKDFGKASQQTQDNQCVDRSSPRPYHFPQDSCQLREDLLWLTAVINRDWLEERRLDTQVIRLYQEPSLIKGYVNDMLLQDIVYNPRVGVNIIPKHVVDIYFPTHPRSKSDILLKLKHRGLLANHGFIRVIPVVL